MARVSFTPNLQRHVACPPTVVTAGTVCEALAGIHWLRAVKNREQVYTATNWG
jgi:hypothetical protein